MIMAFFGIIRAIPNNDSNSGVHQLSIILLKFGPHNFLLHDISHIDRNWTQYCIHPTIPALRADEILQMYGQIWIAVIVCFTYMAAQGNAFFKVQGRSFTRVVYRSSTSPDDTSDSLKARLSRDMKDAMKTKNKERLGAIRAIQTAIKQKEVDERVDVTDEMITNILSKLSKQRRESIKSYTDANRQDLVDVEQTELNTIEEYLPKQLSVEEVTKIVEEYVEKLSATSIKDMGKVMNELRPLLTGKADMASVGDILKKRLSNK